MKNKDGWDIGKGECPCSCNDGVACDYMYNWKGCSIYQEYYKRVEKKKRKRGDDDEL